MRSIFFYILGIGFVAGIFLRTFVEFGYAEMMLLILIGLACEGVRRIRKSSIDAPLFLCMLLCVAVCLGMLRMHVAENTPSIFSTYEDSKVSFEGRVAREPDIRGTTVHLHVRPVSSHQREYVLVMVDRFLFEEKQYAYGDRIEIVGVIEKPKAFASEGGREFDYPGYLKGRNIRYTIKNPEIQSVARNQGSVFGYVFRAKHHFMDTLENALPEPHAGLGEGILLGVKRALGKDLEETFRETGIIHIVVLSGYNIMIVVAFFNALLASIALPRFRTTVIISMIVLFAFLVGLSATVVRASVMAILYTIARMTGRVYAVLRALLLAGVVMLISNPYLLVHDPGFQLSFLATLSLIILAPHVETKLNRVPERFGIREILAATIATQIFVLPLLLYHMGMLSIVSVFVNVLVLPMVPLAMFLTFLTGVAGMVASLFGTLVGFVAYLSLDYILRITGVFGALPFAAVHVEAFPFWVVVATYMVFAYVLVKRSWETSAKSDTLDYLDDWTIVDGTQKVPEAHSASGTSKTFPFR